MNASGIEILTRLLILENRVIGPAVPKALANFHELHGALIPFGLAHMLVVTEILRILRIDRGDDVPTGAALADMVERSEEHTSELQSLMRISYAVFCLKKKISSQRQNKIIETAND